MCAALKEATKITQTWCQEHPNGCPPIVINITDGEATDGDLVAEARELAAVSGEDGSVLLFNIHLSSTADRKSTRLNSSHSQISYAVFCLKKKKKKANKLQ